VPNAASPLGVFDSGLGGLTVVRELMQALPNERIVYLGDTARVPYGTRSPETVLRYARSCASVLLEHDVKALVIACNTASAVAVEMLRAELDLPVIGVIEPGARSALRAGEAEVARRRPPRIGVLGTAGTIASGAYPRAVAQLSTRWEVVGQAAPLLVPLVEEGWLDGEIARLVVERYLGPLVEASVSVLLLGCTHYPLLRPLIAARAEELCGVPLPVVDSAEATASLLSELFAEGRVPACTRPSAEPRLTILVTDCPASFRAVASRFLGDALPEPVPIDL
jgi:glutamate racemase